MAKGTKVAIIIPAYNEGGTIFDVVKSIKHALSLADYTCEVVVIDDGSKDDTAKIAREAGAHVIEHILNSGSGAATSTGMSYAYQAGYDIAATMDGDGQHDPKDVVKGVTKLESGDTDLLLGSRLIDSKGMSRVKLIGNKGLSIITNILFGVSTTDSQSGLRIFSRRALENLKWKTSGYEFCSEMLWRARQQGLIVKEFPIKTIYTEYSQSKGQNNWNAYNIIITLVWRRLAELVNE